MELGTHGTRIGTSQLELCRGAPSKAPVPPRFSSTQEMGPSLKSALMEIEKTAYLRGNGFLGTMHTIRRFCGMIAPASTGATLLDSLPIEPLIRLTRTRRAT